MKHIVVLDLTGALADAVAVEWTDRAENWNPCLRLADGRWRLAGRAPDPGAAPAIALRCRTGGQEGWSPVAPEDWEAAILDRPDAPAPSEPAGPSAPPRAAAPALLPVLLAAPVLAGTGRIGEAVEADPGLWQGASSLDMQWCRDGKPIPGANGSCYVPTVRDDLTGLSLRVTARNGAGARSAATASLPVSHAAPVLRGALPEEVFDQGTGNQEVAAAEIFSGENLSFSARGAGASIDTATGTLLVETGTPADGREITVRAENSGGGAETTLLVSVEGAEEAEAALGTYGGAADEYIRAPWHTEAKQAAGYPPSDNLQVILAYARSPVDSDVIYAGQDVGAFWLSLDSGRSWNTLRNRGLGTVNAVSVACCPADVRHVLCVMGARGPSDGCGIYRSLDGGLSWSRVRAWESFGEPRTALQRLAFAPGTAGRGRDGVRWYAVFDSAKGFSAAATGGTPGLLTSTDGGASWELVRPLPPGVFGPDLYGCRVDPTDETRLYVWGARGLGRFDDAPSPEGGHAWLSGAGGLPAGVVRDLYLSADGQTLICAVHETGIYRSTDGGRSWAAILDWPAVTHCAVNEGHPDTIYAYKRGTRPREQVRYTRDGGRTWRKDAQVIPFPGEGGRAVLGGSEPYILPDPSNAGRATGFADARWFQTDDGGATWNLEANAYFCGAHHKGWASPHGFHATDPKVYFLGMLDAHLLFTGDGGVTLTRRKFDRSALGLVHTSVNGVALHADGTTVMACVGRENKGALCWSRDLGRTWLVADKAAKRRMWLGFDAGHPDYAYQYQHVSADRGRRWTELAMPDRKAVIVGVSQVADGGNSVLYAADIEGRATRIWKSADRGASWMLVINTGYRITSDRDVRTTFRIHPRDPHVIFCRSPSTRNGASQILRLDTVRGDATLMDVFNGRTPEPGFYADNFAIDATDPGVMYLRSASTGTGNYLFMTVDGGGSWENISAGFPNCTGGNGLEVHPLTGVVYIGTANGMYVRRPPYPAPAKDNTWDLLRAAYPGWRNSHFETEF